MSELTPLERLTLAQAVYKVAAEAVSTKNPDSLRSMMDEEAIRAYGESGIKSRDLRINGEKVGTYSVRVRKPQVKDVPMLKDMAAFGAWLDENPDYLREFALSNPDFVPWVVRKGELPDGYELQQVRTPEGASGTTLKVDVEKVAHAMGAELPSAVMGLLGGGA